MSSISTRLFVIILPVALLIFGFSTWLSYVDARDREIASSMQLLTQDRALAQQALETRFDDLTLAHERARDRMLGALADSQFRFANFDRYFTAREDGTRRSIDALWSGVRTPMGAVSGFGAFVSDDELSSERKRILGAAFSAMVGLVDGLPANVNNLYFFSLDNDLIMHAPLRRDQLAFYRRDAPPSLEFQDEEFSQIVTPSANPEGELRCTSLQPILYDETRSTWTTGCMTPVRSQGRQVGAFGSSIPLDEIFEDQKTVAGGDIARVIVTGAGQLVRHPEYTLQNSAETGEFLNLVETDNAELRELWEALDGSESRGLKQYLPKSDLYVEAQRLQRPDWYVVSMMRGKAVRASAFEATRFTLLAGLLTIAAFSLFIVIFVRRQVIQPIQSLAVRADAISLGQGKPDIQAKADRNEMDSLGRAFDAMESRITSERLRLTRSFDLLVDAIEEYAILLLDPAGTVTRANKSAQAAFQWKESESLNQIFPPDDPGSSPTNDLLRKVAEDGRLSQTIMRARGDGSVFWAFEAIDAILDANEGLVGFAYIARDVTKQKDAEAEILEARDSATREADRRRDLLATMSHEIRTPMTGILGMLEQVRQDNSARSRDRALATIENSGEALMRVLDDVLQDAKADSGTMEIEERSFDTTKLIQGCAELFSPLARKKGLALELDPGAREKLRGDPLRIQQIIANFLSNAIKFTSAGTVTLSCMVRPRDDGRVNLEIAVTDTGLGIAAERLESLFDPYEQASASTEREFGGTGLGLSICRKLAQAMGGEVHANSTQGLGSRFLLQLPLRRDSQAVETLPGQGKAAIVLASSATVRLGAEASLEELGYNVQSASSLADGDLSENTDLIVFEAGSVSLAELRRDFRAAAYIALGQPPQDEQGSALRWISPPVTAQSILDALSGGAS